MKDEEIKTFETEREPLERALLCSLFLSGKSLLEVISVVRPEMFSNPDYGFVYDALLAVYNNGNHPDFVLVETEMKRRNLERFRALGGLSCLLDRVENFRLEKNVQEYACEMKRLFLLDSLHKLFRCKALECLSFDADFQRLIAGCTEEMNRLCEDNRESDAMVSLYQLAQNSISFQKKRMEQKEDPRMMRTGIRGLDGIIGGLYRQEMMVIGGATSDGKTALSMFIAMNVALRNKHVLHFSYEMTGEQTVEREFSSYTSVEADRLRIGGIRETDIQELEKYTEGIKDLSYFFVNDTRMTLEEMRAEIVLRSRRGVCDLVVVDYLHAMDVPGVRGESQELIIRHLVNKLKGIAMEADCALLLVSQLNREAMKRDNSMPKLTDLRDSGAIEYVADTVIIVNRLENEPLIKLFVLKNRNGATGVANLYHNGSFSHFYEAPQTLPFED